MREKRCRLSKADKWFMGGGGGGGGLGAGAFRTPSKEKKAVQNWETMQINREGQFVREDPLLGPAQTEALDYNKTRLPELLGQFPGFAKQLQGQQGQLSDQYGTLSSLLGAPGGPLGTALSGGALTGQLGRDASQQFRDTAAAGGNLRSLGSAGQELLNRDAYRQQRYNTALQQSQGLVGQQQGNIAAQSGLTGAEAALPGQEQVVQTGGINQLLGVGNAGVSQFTGLTNPVLGYLSGLYSGNQQAAISQAQIQAQQSAAAKSGQSGMIGGGIAAVGSIAAAAI